MTIPVAWENLRRAVNGQSGVIGTPGGRDPEAVCEAFDGEGFDETGKCMSDGHYLCVECSELSPEAPRFEENYGEDGLRDRDAAYVRTMRMRRERAALTGDPKASGAPEDRR